MHRPNSAFSLSGLRRHYTDPHRLYDALRAHESISFDPMSRCWLVTGHSPVLSILNDSRFSSRLDSTLGMRSLHKQMIFMDGEEHQKRQEVIVRSSAQIAKKMPEAISRFAQSALMTLRRTGEMDVVNDFASPISLMSIAEMLGVPMSDQKELAQLEHWSDTFGDITSGYFSGAMQDVIRLEDSFRHLIAEKRSNPTPVSDDMLGAFMVARDLFHDDEDLVANCMMVFSAGRITTKKLLGNGIPLLLKHWDQLQKAFQEDARRTAKMVTEELLRMVTPTRSLVRQATEDVDLSSTFSGHHLIRRGEHVLLFLEAANYDPARFNAPASFDPHRRPNKHIAFGAGSHQCPGATLARLEIQIALEALFSITNLRPKPNVRPTWNPNPNLGGFMSYHVVSDVS